MISVIKNNSPFHQVGGDVSTWPRELPFSLSLGVTLELVAIAVIYCKKTDKKKRRKKNLRLETRLRPIRRRTLPLSSIRRC